MQLVSEVAREQTLLRVLADVRDEYDYILIDCQPSLGLLTVNALTAAQGVIIPLECEFFSLRGVALLVDTIDKVKERLNPSLEISGILATMYDTRTVHCREVFSRVVEAFDDTVFQTVIQRTVRFPETTVAGQPITTWPRPPAAPRLPAAGARDDPPLERGVSPAAVAVSAPGRSTARRSGAASATARPADGDDASATPGFLVSLDTFEGPFDLLLSLIAKHKMDITVVALSKVTDEFLAHLRSLGPDWEIGQVSEFLVVAATLLDLKAARLLPTAAVEDEEDLALLEARDLLVARLLQYRAVKQVAEQLAVRWAEAGRSVPARRPARPRVRGRHARARPRDLPAKLAALAMRALTPKPPSRPSPWTTCTCRSSASRSSSPCWPTGCVGTASTFRALARDADGAVVVVARFLALLELYRDGQVSFDQLEPLGELHVRWTGRQPGTIDLRKPAERQIDLREAADDAVAADVEGAA